MAKLESNLTEAMRIQKLYALVGCQLEMAFIAENEETMRDAAEQPNDFNDPSPEIPSIFCDGKSAEGQLCQVIDIFGI